MSVIYAAYLNNLAMTDFLTLCNSWDALHNQISVKDVIWSVNRWISPLSSNEGLNQQPKISYGLFIIRQRNSKLSKMINLNLINISSLKFWLPCAISKTAISPVVVCSPKCTPDTNSKRSSMLNWENCVYFQWNFIRKSSWWISWQGWLLFQI